MLMECIILDGWRKGDEAVEFEERFEGLSGYDHITKTNYGRNNDINQYLIYVINFIYQ